MKSIFFSLSPKKTWEKHVGKVIKKMWVQSVPSTVKVGSFIAP